MASAVLSLILYLSSSSIEPVLMSVDVECATTLDKEPTEIGISILDTRDIRGVSPGIFAKNWVPHIKARHLRILEFGNLIDRSANDNTGERLWVGNQFRFGKSEWIHHHDVAEAIKAQLSITDDQAPGLCRAVILVGLGWEVVESFFKLNFKGLMPSRFYSAMGAIDTTYLAQILIGQGASLKDLLEYFRYAPVAMGNAGNDAFYGMMLLLRIAASRGPLPDSPSMSSQSAQDVLNAYIEAQMAKTPLVDPENRCTACGIQHHHENVCYWLHSCGLCGEVGHCVHRHRRTAPRSGPFGGAPAQQAAPAVQPVQAPVRNNVTISVTGDETPEELSKILSVLTKTFSEITIASGTTTTTLNYGPNSSPPSTADLANAVGRPANNVNGMQGVGNRQTAGALRLNSGPTVSSPLVSEGAHLLAMEQSLTSKRDIHQHRRRNGLCTYCGVSGHWKRDCQKLDAKYKGLPY